MPLARRQLRRGSQIYNTDTLQSTEPVQNETPAWIKASQPQQSTQLTPEIQPQTTTNIPSGSFTGESQQGDGKEWWKPVTWFMSTQEELDTKKKNKLLLDYKFNKDPVGYMNSLEQKDKDVLYGALEERTGIKSVDYFGGGQPMSYSNEVALGKNMEQQYQLKQREINPEQFMGVEGTPAEIIRGAGQAIGSTESAVGGILQQFDITKKAGQNLTRFGESVQEEFKFKHPITQEFDLEQMSDARFWTQNIPQLVTYVGLTAPVSIGVGLAGTEIAGAVGLGAVGTAVTGLVFAGLGSRVTESLIEGGGAFNEAKKLGADDEKASKVFQSVFNKNMAMVFTDVPQFLLTFGTGGKSSWAKTLAKLSGNVATEGGEEVLQSAISESALAEIKGEEFSWENFFKDPNTLKAFILGGVGGVGFSGLGYISDKLGLIQNEVESKKNEIKKYAEKGDDSFLDLVDASIIKGEITQTWGYTLKKIYNEYKETFLNKVEPVVSKIAVKVGAKMNFMPDSEGRYADLTPEEDAQARQLIQEQAKSPDPEILQDLIEYTDIFSDSVPWKAETVAYLEQQKKYILQAYDLGKINGLIEEYGKEEFESLRNLWLNNRDKELIIEDFKKTKLGKQETYKKGLGALDTYVGRLSGDGILTMTLQDAYEAFVDKITQPARKRVKKPKPLKLIKKEKPKKSKPQTEKRKEIIDKRKNTTKEVNIYFGGIEGGVIIGPKGMIDTAINNEEYASNYAKKHSITQRGNATIYKGKADISSKEVFSKEKINKIKNKNLKEIINKYTENGKHEISWQEIGHSKDGGKQFIQDLKNEGYKAFIKNEREGIDAFSIIDQEYLDKINLQSNYKQTEFNVAQGEQTQMKGVDKDGKTKIKKVQKETKQKTVEKIENNIAIEKLAKQIINLAKKDPTLDDIANLLNKTTDETLKKALKYAVEKNMISKDSQKFFMDAINEITIKNTKAPTGYISDKQRLHILDMLGWSSIFKKIEDYKINMLQLSRSLKNIKARIHLVNSPEGQRVKLPFSLMGNKSMTFKNILLPMIKRAITQGAKTYVEAFGGAGTVYNFAEEMIASGIENLHINHFDNEKFTIIEAIKNGKIHVVQEVLKAYNKIIDEIGVELAIIPEVKEIMDTYNVKVGSKGFKEMAELFFYPQYAKQFFQERPDTKLGINGELSATFKEWLTEHITEESKKVGKELTEEEIELTVQNILNDESVFENKYPSISKKISNIFDKYDNVDFEKGDVESAMLTAMVRHLRQRGDSGQKVVSASGGFQSVIGVRDKMIEGLEKYQKVFNQYGDKIHIYNMDGKEFIKQMGETYNSKETVSYYDPPYIRTTGVYIKNQPKEVQESLQEYSDPLLIDQLFSPMKDSIMMFTNDINGLYFETLNEMLGDRMSRDILGYREGTTPTSLVTTTEIEIKPADVGLSYYKIIKNQYTKNMFASLKENLYPKIAKQLEKHLAKFQMHFEKLMKEKFGELTKIQNEVFKGAEAYQKLEESLNTLVSGNGKQEMLREAKKWVKQNKVTGADLIKMIDKINKMWVSRQAKVNLIKDLNSTMNSSETIDATVRQDYQKWFNTNYTTKKISSKTRQAREIVTKFETTDTKLTPEEFNIYENYTEKHPNTINRTSLFDMDIDQLNELQKNIELLMTEGKDTKKYYEIQEKQVMDEYIEKAKQTAEKIEETTYLVQDSIENLSKFGKIGYWIKKSIHNLKINTIKEALDYMPSLHVLEKLGIHRQIYDIYKKAYQESYIYIHQIDGKFFELQKKLNLNKDNYIKIGLYGLANRGDGKGKIKILAYLKAKKVNPITGQAVTTKEQILDFLELIQSEEFLTPQEKESYDFMRENLDATGDIIFETSAIHKSHLATRVESYFPIRLDGEFNDLDIDPEIGDVVSSNMRRANIASGFLEQTTNKMTVPILEADKIFLNHINKSAYYGFIQIPLTRLNKLQAGLGEEFLGNVGNKYFGEWLKVMAQQGLVEKNLTKNKIRVAKATKRTTKAIVAYNLGSILIQPFAIIESKIAGTKILDVFKNIVSNRNEIDEKSLTYKTRDFKHLFEDQNKFKNYFDKFVDSGLAPMGFIDTKVYKSIWYSIYKDTQKLGWSEEDSIYISDLIAEKALAPTLFDGKSMYILNHERGGMAWTTAFMTFTSNRFAEIFLQGGKSAVELIVARSKKPITTKLLAKAKLHAKVNTLLVIALLAFLLEDLPRELADKILGKPEKEKEGILSKIISNTLGLTPLGSIIGSTKYGGPIFLQPFKEIYTGIQTKTPELKYLHYLNGILLGLGVPKAFIDLYKGYIKEEIDNNKSSSSGDDTGGSRRRPRRTRKRRTRKRRTR